MIVMPVKNTIRIKRMKLCIQCNKLFIENLNTKDHGICSLECGYKLRGLSQWDFIDSPMDKLNEEIEKIIDLGKY